LSDGGGTDVGGVGSQQTQDTGTNSTAPPWVASAGWIANGAGGWTSSDGASHWGPREKPPLVLANYKEDQQRALQQREDRMRCGQAPTIATNMHLAYSPTRKTMIPRHRTGSQTSARGIPSDGET
jgi:hypothetical protein